MRDARWGAMAASSCQLGATSGLDSRHLGADLLV